MTNRITLDMTRRGFLGTALGGAAALAAGPSWAAAKTLNILSHKVHETVLGTGTDNDLMKDWKAKNDANLVFTTFDSNPLQDRLFREASLPSTDYGVGYIIDNRPTADIAKLFAPLDDFLASAPIENYDDIAPGLREAMTVGGKTIGIPVRHATGGLFYNEQLLEEAGISAPPATLEELIEQAKKLTFTSKDGTPVTGMIMASDLAVFPVSFARAYGGDYITKDFKLLPKPEAMEKALATMADLFKAGALPRSYATTKNDDQVTWMQQGRAAFTMITFARFKQFNDPAQSKFPGRIKAVQFPKSSSYDGEMAAVTESWGMTIPANFADKELAWSYIREVSSPRVTLGMAKNGNGPVRVSTYADADFAAASPVAAAEAKALATARGAFPPFPEAARAQQLFLEDVQLAVLGRKTPAEAVESMVTRITPLLPS
jgi:multiple sugar transport system substrate-binding protein